MSIYNNYRKCIICTSNHNTEIGIFNNLRKVRCIDCGHVFANPVPSETEYNSWYALDEFWIKSQENIHKSTIYNRISHDYDIAKDRIESIKSIYDIENSRLLDIGCSNGSFMLYAKEQGIDCEGVELFEETANIAKKVSNCKVHIGSFSNFKNNNKYNIITMHDVLEHCYKPILTMDNVMAHLADSGLLVIEIPDRESLDAKREKKEWRHLQYREHLFLFSLEDIRFIMQKYNKKIVHWFRPIPSKLTIYIM